MRFTDDLAGAGSGLDSITESRAGMLRRLREIETPAVVIDRERLTANIERMQAVGDRHGLKLRPHIKTHKSVRIARLQMDGGACGITASKPSEAQIFIQAGIPSVTVAYPLIDMLKLRRLMKAAVSSGTELQLIVDSRRGLAVVIDAAEKEVAAPGVFVKIDVGLHRCGLSENDPRILEIASSVHGHPALRFAGLLSHAGHAYGATDVECLRGIAEAERLQMIRIRDHIRKQGVPVSEISVGATPTVLAADRFDGITEIRPGNYVFLDRTPVRMGLVEPEAVALTVIATVVSRNPEYLIIDAGSKTLTSDQGAHGTAGGGGFGVGQALEAFGRSKDRFPVIRLSEEHGFISRSDADLEPGEKVRIIPNHACPVANLAGVYHVIDNDRFDIWPVDAAGHVR